MVFSSVVLASSFASCLMGFKNSVDQFSPAMITQAPVPSLFKLGRNVQQIELIKFKWIS